MSSTSKSDLPGFYCHILGEIINEMLMDLNSVSIINYKNYFIKKMWRAGKLVGGH